MNSSFVINTEATHRDLIWDLFGQLHELEGSLHVMAVAAHADGLSEGPVLALIRQAQNIHQLAEAVTTDKAAKEERKVPEAEQKREEKCVKPYFDPATDDEKRAQLEASISDEDFAAELDTIKYQEKTFSAMVKQTEERLQWFNELKTKRAEKFVKE